MGILDEAIREHLELKRQHGADQSELQQLEDEAFGSPARPGDEAGGDDQLAEAPTEFMAQPDAATAEPDAVPDGAEASGAPAESAERTSTRGEGPGIVADLQEAPPAPERADEAVESESSAEEPSAEEPSATEHEVVDSVVAADPASSGPNTQEREAIAEHPTEMYDVEEELTGTREEGASADEVEDDEEDDFWDEKRLSDELDQALETPLADDDSGDEGDEEEVGEGQPRGSAGGEEDVLEETPEFLEETPEDDELWFEQKPPKDFDFDD
jgi:hypothetical protein